MKPYVRNIVLKFYANPYKSIFDDDNKLYQKVIVHGEWYKFGPAKIRKSINCFSQNMVELNKSIDETVVVVTNSVHHTWPEKSNLYASSLFTMNAGLFAIAIRNWLPNRQRDSMKGKHIVNNGSKETLGIEFDGANKVEATQNMPIVVGPKSIPLGINHRKNVELKFYIKSNQRHVDRFRAEIKEMKEVTNRKKVVWANLLALFDNE
ncbi:hypothetical protein J1N35_043333 [Gossypium stocksii]|uniref:Uncharacterized protein n=1 Tax=Gossypium stocksii TaxID=47602 RepID=A0A9D3ZEW7_9ROSI|nr:hypothetical protein J1N35_043333 [Gossypium stocksii]